jgi:phage replication O-like protein O
LSGRDVLASPQTAHGFTRLADELLDALIRFPFTKRQYKVLLAMIRKTYGFQKREDDITAPQLAEMTGLDRANVIRTINELVAAGALIKRPGQFGQVLGINKDYESWTVPKRHRASAKMAPGGVPKQHRQRCQSDTGTGARMAPTIDNHQQTLSKRQPPPQERAGEARASPPAQPSPTSGSGGEELVFPREMTGMELKEARTLVSRAGRDAQAVLDVLAAAIRAGEIRKSRLAVLTGLVRRYEAGTFDPAPGLHLAEHRRRAAAVESAQRKREKEYAQALDEQAQASDGVGRAAFQQVLKRLNRG